MAIADADQLARAEAEFAYHAEVRPYAEGVEFSRYDLPPCRRYIVNCLRRSTTGLASCGTVDLGNGATTFARARHLRSAAEQVFRQLPHQDQFRHLAPPRFARGAGRLLADLNALHPFREATVAPSVCSCS